MSKPPSRPTDPAMSRVFSALGDATRLHLVHRLVECSPLSVSELGEGLPVTRQGVTKHLLVLEEAGVVSARKEGRERLYTLEEIPLRQAREFLAGISAGWDRALIRLRKHVEED
ncbi:MAG TPA: metalloregulator ArsR/SmtB family transcription factor [Haloferula sp.]